MSAHRLGILALLSVAVLHAITSGRFIGSSVVALVLLGAFFVPLRADVGPFLQRVLTFFAALTGGIVAFALAPASFSFTVLARGWSVAATAVLFAVAFRSWVRSPEGGFFATFVIGMLGLVFAGETRTGAVFPVFVVIYLLLGILALRAHDDGRPPISALGARGVLASGASLGLAVVLAIGLSQVLPRASIWARDKLLSSLGVATTGLSERMVLGSLEGMLSSEEIVARVYGPPVDYLRGVVYDHYQAGQWAVSTIDGTRTVHIPGASESNEAPSQPSRVRIVFSGTGKSDRYVLPLGATGVTVAANEAIVDRFGALRTRRGQATALEFDLPAEAPDGSIDPGDFRPAAPTTDDRRRPVKLARHLSPMVRGWIRKEDPPEKRVEIIADKLRRELRYSLDYKRGPGDPLLDFLENDKRGHCEYFASAMAVLARQAGVPARVVAGYRVAERNELGGYSIIREKNAHAWVEVYLEGKGWVTVDATPEDLLGQNRPHEMPFFASLLDLSRASLSWLVEQAELPSMTTILVTLVGLTGLWVGVRWLQRRRRRDELLEAAFFAIEAPPAALVLLETALASAGARRGPSETIERFAERLSTPDDADVHTMNSNDVPPLDASLQQAGALLMRYAALRYGGVGESGPLFEEMRECASRLQKRAS